MVDWRTPMHAIEFGTGRQIREGNDIAILTIGHQGNYALEAAEKLYLDEQISAAVFDMRFVKPLDEELLHEVFKNFNKVVTVEDGCIMGGFGSAILEFMADHDYQAEILRLGIPDDIIEHGSQSELQKQCGFDSDGIYNAALKMATEAVPVS